MNCDWISIFWGERDLRHLYHSNYRALAANQMQGRVDTTSISNNSKSRIDSNSHMIIRPFSNSQITIFELLSVLLDPSRYTKNDMLLVKIYCFHRIGLFDVGLWRYGESRLSRRVGYRCCVIDMNVGDCRQSRRSREILSLSNRSCQIIFFLRQKLGRVGKGALDSWKNDKKVVIEFETKRLLEWKQSSRI